MGSTGFFACRYFEGFAYGFGDNFGQMEERIPFRHRFENRDDIHVLVRFLVHPVKAGLSGDCDERCPIHIGISNSGDKVHGSGTKGSETDPCASSEATVDICHEGGSPFIARLNKLNIGFQ